MGIETTTTDYLTRGIRVRFNGERIIAHCFRCNYDFDVTVLVQELKKYSRESCPSILYQAWKVLVLGTDEYYAVDARQPDFEHRVVEQAAKSLSTQADTPSRLKWVTLWTGLGNGREHLVALNEYSGYYRAACSIGFNRKRAGVGGQGQPKCKSCLRAEAAKAKLNKSSKEERDLYDKGRLHC